MAGRTLLLHGPALQPFRRQVQIVFQDPYSSLNPRLTVRQSIGEPMLVHGLASRDELRHQVNAVLEMVGLSPEYAERYPHEMSGGQRQRVGIARALGVQPQLIVADEAVSALDVSVRAQILNLFVELRQRLGLAYLFISHDLGVVRFISHRVAVMYLGQLVEVGPAAALLPIPAPLRAGAPGCHSQDWRRQRLHVRSHRAPARRGTPQPHRRTDGVSVL